MIVSLFGPQASARSPQEVITLPSIWFFYIIYNLEACTAGLENTTRGHYDHCLEVSENIEFLAKRHDHVSVDARATYGRAGLLNNFTSLDQPDSVMEAQYRVWLNEATTSPAISIFSTTVVKVVSVSHVLVSK